MGGAKKAYSYSWYKIPKNITLTDINNGTFEPVKLAKRIRAKISKNDIIICLELNKEFTLEEAKIYVNAPRYTNILKCCRGEYQQAYGYHWKLKQST